MRNTADNIHFLSCTLDPDEREPRIEKKRKAILNPGLLEWSDPSVEIEKRTGKQFNRIDVESWLRPLPEPSDLPLMSVENFVVFIDSGGCLEYAELVEETCRDVESLPVLIGVDHSLSGGVLRAVSERMDGEKLIYLVLDAHFDCILPEIRCGLLQYDAETNPESRYSTDNPFIYGRPNSYNADSFLHFLWEWNVVERESTIVAGVVDYPPESAQEIDDSRVARYVNFYLGQEERGVKIIRSERLRSNPAGIIRSAIEECDGDAVYISIDLDVGANTCCDGVRFSEHRGVGCKAIVETVRSVTDNCRIAGIDICEFDPYSSGKLKPPFDVALSILEIIDSAFNRNN